jgi:ABC-type proline/glycine betaine transport system permease subunit
MQARSAPVDDAFEFLGPGIARLYQGPPSVSPDGSLLVMIAQLPPIFVMILLAALVGWWVRRPIGGVVGGAVLLGCCMAGLWDSTLAMLATALGVCAGAWLVGAPLGYLAARSGRALASGQSLGLVVISAVIVVVQPEWALPLLCLWSAGVVPAVVFFRSVRAIPADVRQCARAFGANWVGVFRKIELPVLTRSARCALWPSLLVALGVALVVKPVLPSAVSTVSALSAAAMLVGLALTLLGLVVALGRGVETPARCAG